MTHPVIEILNMRRKANAKKLGIQASFDVRLPELGLRLYDVLLYRSSRPSRPDRPDVRAPILPNGEFAFTIRGSFRNELRRAAVAAFGQEDGGSVETPGPIAEEGPDAPR